jgi:hypothetical protein
VVKNAGHTGSMDIHLVIASNINILPHADCLAVFVEKFAVLDKAVFFVKGKDTLVVFNIGVYGEEAGGAVIVIAGHCFVFGKL